MRNYPGADEGLGKRFGPRPAILGKGGRSFRTREWGFNVEIVQWDRVSRPAFIGGSRLVNKEDTALKQRWSSLPAALRALLVPRLDGERNDAETTDASRTSIRKGPPLRVDVDAE